ncbi:2028_t:CDS:2 [Funneliformis mosseae]|uniref:2028_t:CDS:1 n=1 Tax=Funneliformis mosseae TaxID=27381 RepID=A0A9N9N755_FUNMO|nr:2028_t:CDS:2 [Funneliformis mosseae]
MTTPKRRQTLQGQVTTTNKSSKTKITRSTISSPMSSGPPSPVKMHMKSKSLTLRGSPKKDLNSENSSEFLFDEKDTATTATTESIASPVQSDKTNPEESDPNSASIITSPTQSLENHESIEQAIKTLEEKIKLDQHEHAIRILLRQLQQPEYKNETVDDDSSTVSKKKPVRTNKLAGTFPKSRPQSGFYSYNNNSQRSQTIIERKTPIVSTLPAKNLCTCRDPDSFWCRVNTEFAVAEQWRIRRHSPATTEVIHQKAKYTSQLFDFRELNIPDMEEVACEISHSEHAQSQQPAAESNNPPNHDTINQKTPSKEHVEIEF